MSSLRVARGKWDAFFRVLVQNVRNVSVKEYESPDLGTSALSGEVYLSGMIQVRPRGASWSVYFPFHGRFIVREHAPSGTVSITAKEKKDPGSRLAEWAFSNQDMIDQVIKELGRVDFVPAEEQRLRSAAIRLAAELPVGSKQRRDILATLRDKEANLRGDAAWVQDKLKDASEALRDALDVLEARTEGESLADTYSDIARLADTIRQFSKEMYKGQKALDKVR